MKCWSRLCCDIVSYNNPTYNFTEFNVAYLIWIKQGELSVNMLMRPINTYEPICSMYIHTCNL